MGKKKTYEKLYVRNRKYRIRSFWTSVLLIVLLVVGYRYARSLCQEYENVQPHHVAEKEIERLSAGDYTDIIEGDDGNIPSDEYVQYLTEVLSGRKITYSKVSSSDPDKCLYNLYADGERFGRVYLTESESKSKHGFPMWAVEKTVSYISIPTTPTISAMQYIRAQESSTVMVNNVPLTEEHIVEAGIDSIYDGHLLENVPSQKECIYAFPGEDVDIEVIDSKGNHQEVVLIDDVYTAIRNYDNEERENFRKLVEDTLIAIARYTVGFTNIYGTSRCVEPKTTAYDYLFMYSYGGSEKALSISDFDEIFVEDFVMLSEDSFACVAKTTYNCVYSTKGEIEYNIDYLLFYKKYYDGWRVYDMVFR
ncbi:MAG: hypothetical protein IJB25_02570 [Clostridia bacterium]|nr:hypothetical protein [Clostridia bacterium]